MDLWSSAPFWIVLVFCLGYAAIIFEYSLKVNKTAVALLVAALCWAVFFISNSASLEHNLLVLGHHVSEVAQIVLFLLGAMTLVELIDSHGGFKILTDRIRTRSKVKMIWLVGASAFFLSAVLDNLTTSILMVSVLRKLVPVRADRLTLCCIIVVAANAGGAWTPIGDITTTMLWIQERISSWPVMRALFVPSLISVVIPLIWYTVSARGRLAAQPHQGKDLEKAPGATLVFLCGVGALVSVPVFKALTGLPPFMGILLALGLLWLITDLLHHPYEEREKLRVPHVLTRIDTSGILFFLGILLCVDALDVVGVLRGLATWLDTAVGSPLGIATLLGLFSAVIDNVPLVAAAMGMYPLENYPMDSFFWHLIAYAAGTGGSILIIGSAAGVALMGMEKIDFMTYVRKASVPIALGYFGGIGVYSTLQLFGLTA